MTIASILGTSSAGRLRRVRIDGAAPAGTTVSVTLRVTDRSVRAEAEADDDGIWTVDFDHDDDLSGLVCGARVAVRAELDAGPYVEWGGLLECRADAGAPDEPLGAASELGAAPVVVIRQPPESGHRVSVTVEGDGTVRRSGAADPEHSAERQAEPRDRSRDAEPWRRPDPDARATRREPRRMRETEPAGGVEPSRAYRSDPFQGEVAERRPASRSEDEAVYVSRRTRDDDDLPHPLTGRHDEDRPRRELRRDDDARAAPRRTGESPTKPSRPRDRPYDERRAEREATDDRERADDRHSAEDEDASTPWVLGGLLALSMTGVIVSIAAQGYPVLIGAAVALCLPLSATLASSHSARGWAVWGGAGLAVGVVAVVVLLPMVSFVQLDTYLIAAAVVAAGVSIGIGVELVFGGSDDDAPDRDEDSEDDRARRREPSRRRSAPSSRRR